MTGHRGILLVISGPSGTGKGTICKELISRNPDLQFSISATTRKPREGEVDGRDYFFVSETRFQEMIRNQELVEWAQYCNNYYGTPRRFISECLDNGKNMILEINVEGALNIKRLFPESVLIFILPPSLQELENRLKNRGTETPEVIKNRLDKSRKELELVHEYNYAVVNDDLEQAVRTVECIIEAEKCRVRTEIDYTDLLNLRV